MPRQEDLLRQVEGRYLARGGFDNGFWEVAGGEDDWERRFNCARYRSYYWEFTIARGNAASGCKLTWYGGGSKASQLDRFLVSSSWVEKFVDLVQHNLPRNIFDHSPVRLSSGAVDWGPRPFRFLNCWLEKPSHVKLMGEEWGRITGVVQSPMSIMDKLRLLKSFLKVWNREPFGSVDLQIEVSTKLINDLDE
ncbi:hypothetical protein V6N13_047668 [Hibiscus sabdariffa]